MENIHPENEKEQKPKESKKENLENSLIDSENLSDEDKLFVIDTCLSYATYEANVYWQRNAIYLTLNSIMFGAILAFSKSINNILIFSIGGFGAFLNWHWISVNKYSKYLAERWREDARNVARQSEKISKLYRALLGNSPLEKPKCKKPSSVMNQMSASFRLLWIIIMIYGIVKLVPEFYNWFTEMIQNFNVKTNN